MSSVDLEIFYLPCTSIPFFVDFVKFKLLVNKEFNTRKGIDFYCEHTSDEWQVISIVKYHRPVVVAQAISEATSNQRGTDIENFQSITALILDYLDQQINKDIMLLPRPLWQKTYSTLSFLQSWAGDDEVIHFHGALPLIFLLMEHHSGEFLLVRCLCFSQEAMRPNYMC